LHNIIYADVLQKVIELNKVNNIKYNKSNDNKKTRRLLDNDLLNEIYKCSHKKYIHNLLERERKRCI